MSSQVVLSTHMPKAGGTSLLRQFQKIFGDGVLHHLPDHPQTSPALPIDDSVRVVHGHFHPQVYDHVSPAFRCTFLREPVDNLISIYLYWQELTCEGGPEYRRFMLEKPTLLELAAYPGLRRLASDAMYGGFDMDRFDFIGFHDDRHADMAELGRQLGLPLSGGVWENRTQDLAHRGRELRADTALCAQVRAVLADDVAFYQDQWERRKGKKAA